MILSSGFRQTEILNFNTQKARRGKKIAPNDYFYITLFDSLTNIALAQGKKIDYCRFNVSIKNFILVIL